MKTSLSIVIPVLSDSIGLENRLDELLQTEFPLLEIVEVILVLDGNQDTKWDWVNRATKAYPHIKALYLSIKEGRDHCTLQGLLMAQADLCLTIDAQAKYRTEDINTLYQLIHRSNCNLVYGFSTQISPGVLGNIGYRVRSNLFSLLTGIPAYFSEFRLMEQALIQALHSEQHKHFSLDKTLISKQPIYAGIPVQLKESSNLQTAVLGSNLRWKSIMAASNFMEYLCIVILALNTWLLWNGYMISALTIGALCTYLLIKVFLIKWQRRSPTHIKQKLNFA